ncbi:hypothetical protein M0813_05504 [Anaeramoeba flamelloides]|uniref:Uncharacterized protein n=1 Tax=Anaeramoeba flamelloides TaxID=1746091 RepID=A0ABQ8XGN9_9EUKA|nr:hypothetical protein M0813_05504 [Anaeramoeba flamelloides]
MPMMMAVVVMVTRMEMKRKARTNENGEENQKEINNQRLEFPKYCFYKNPMQDTYSTDIAEIEHRLDSGYEESDSLGINR